MQQPIKDPVTRKELKPTPGSQTTIKNTQHINVIKIQSQKLKTIKLSHK